MTSLTNRFSKFYLFQALLVTFLGAAIILLPMFTTFTLALLIGLVLTVFGVYKIINVILARSESSNIWFESISGLLMSGVGIYLVMKPLLSVVVLTIALSIYFIMEGANSVAFAYNNRHNYKYWWVSLIIGLAQLALAAVILVGLPNTALYVIGLVAGVSFLFTGVSMLALYFGTRHAVNEDFIL